MKIIRQIGLCLLIIFIHNNSFTQPYKTLYPKTSHPCEIVEHTYFSLCYSEADEQAFWVIYMLTRNRVENNTCARTDNFRIDPAISSGSATPADYKNSGYDRGHLCPAADMNFNCQAMKESFFMSNMSPQLPAFNRGIWKKLEDKIRDWALMYDTLIIITAGVLQMPCIGHIGTNNVSIPPSYYKVIYRNKEGVNSCIAFLMANDGSDKPLVQFAVSVDSLESLTNINFFPSLPDSIENSIEENINIEKWEFENKSK